MYLLNFTSWMKWEKKLLWSNRHPTKTLDGLTPFFVLYSTQPSYAHLWVFGYACYPNLSSTAPHKLSPRSNLCVLIGYSTDNKGYQCLDLHSNRVIVSRHVVFNESLFPISEMPTSPLDRMPPHWIFERWWLFHFARWAMCCACGYSSSQQCGCRPWPYMCACCHLGMATCSISRALLTVKMAQNCALKTPSTTLV